MDFNAGITIETTDNKPIDKPTTTNKLIEISLERNQKKKSKNVTIIRGLLEFVKGDNETDKLNEIKNILKELKGKLGTNGSIMKDENTKKLNGNIELFGERTTFVCEYLKTKFKLSGKELKKSGFN